MHKIIALFICHLLVVPYMNAQNKTVRTTFYQDGFLSKHQNDFSETIAEFNQNDVCTVLEYLGKDIYKVRYKGKTGYVSVDDLEVNEGMMDLYYAFQDEAKQRAIEERKRKQNDLVRGSAKTQDSIAKAEEQKRMALIAQSKKDSLEKIRETEQLKLIAQKRADSIAKIKEQQRLALQEKRRLDSIAKAEEQKRQALLAQRKKDSLENIRETERLKLIAQKRADSITKIKEQQRLAFLEKQRLDSINQAEIQRKKLQELKSQEYLAKAKAEHNKIEESQKTTHTPEPKEIVIPTTTDANRSTTCNYLINEYDDFYKIKNIQTEPYALSKDLNIELYRHGHKLNVFFNLSESLGCASYMSHNRSSVKVKLENNQTVSFYHSWGVECGNFTFKGRISKAQIMQLLRSPIKSILLRGTKSSIEINDITDKYFFIDKLHCLEIEK